MTTKRASRLDDIISQAQHTRADELVEETPSPELPPLPIPEPPKRAIRKLGKSKDPDFKQTTLYVRKHTFNTAQAKLIGAGRDLSDVVEALLTKWNTGEVDV